MTLQNAGEKTLEAITAVQEKAMRENTKTVMSDTLHTIWSKVQEM